MTLDGISLPLQIGTSKHQSVRRLQAALLQLGYDIGKAGVDGYFGPATQAAVKEFQRKHDFFANGVATQPVINSIERDLNEKKPPLVIDGKQPPWLRTAIDLIGTHEIIGSQDNPTIMKWAKTLGGAIAAEYLSDATAWCALFVNYVLGVTGHKGTGTLWALDFATWGQQLSGPAVGAIAPMTRAGGGHVAIVVGKDRDNNLMMVGGNQSDAVNIKMFPRNRPVAFRWPLDYPLPQDLGMASLPVVTFAGEESTKES